MMDPMEPVLRMTLVVSVIIGTLLDIICLKKRGLANVLIYFECVTRLIASMIPNHTSFDQSGSGYVNIFGMIFIMLYCDEGRQIVFNTLTFAWHLFFTNMVAYQRAQSIGSVVMGVILSFGYLTGTLFIGMVISYIAKVNERLH